MFSHKIKSVIGLLILMFAFQIAAHASDTSTDIDLDKVLRFAKGELLQSKRSGLSVKEEVQANTVYEVSTRGTNWSSGYTTLFVGVRLKSQPRADFLKHLTRHVQEVRKKFQKFGLKGYIFSATSDYEIAWQNWTSKSDAEKAFQSGEGQPIVQDAMSFMGMGFYKQMNWRTKMPVKALIVVTSHSELGSSGRKTGFYLSEVTHPFFKLAQAGIDVDFVSPHGGKAPMDERSRTEDDAENKKFLADPKLLSRLEHTLKLSEVNPDEYSAILFAGGHGTMWDFPNDQALARLTAQIYERGGVVAAVCHGPAALTNVKLSNGKYLIEGKQVAAFTNSEEAAVKLNGVVPFALETELSKRGAVFKGAKDWAQNVVVDGRLITGQNPQSASRLGEKMVRALTR